MASTPLVVDGTSATAAKYLDLRSLDGEPNSQEQRNYHHHRACNDGQAHGEHEAYIGNFDQIRRSSSLPVIDQNPHKGLPTTGFQPHSEFRGSPAGPHILASGDYRLRSDVGKKHLWSLNPHTNHHNGYQEVIHVAEPNNTIHCLNIIPGQNSANVPFRKYQPCPCKHCYSKDCSVFVGGCGHFGLRQAENIQQLHNACSRFGQVLAIRVKSKGKAAEVQFADPSSAMAAIRHLDMTIIPGVCPNTLRVNHPFRSQYFQPWPRHGNHDDHHFDLRPAHPILDAHDNYAITETEDSPVMPHAPPPSVSHSHPGS